MEKKEHDLIANEKKLKRGFVILAVILVLLILGYFTGQALYQITH